MEAEPAISEPAKCKRWFRFRRLALLVGAVACGFAFWLVYRGVSESLDAENTLQAHNRTLAALTRFVQSNGRWPKGWAELAAIDSGRQGGLLDWYYGMDDLQSRVQVNFQLDLKDVAAMSLETFSAVKQKAPNYPPNEALIRDLLNVARKKDGA